MPAVVAKETEIERARREALIADGDKRLDAFLAEFRAELGPLLTKHGMRLADDNILHHRGAAIEKVYGVLHFYVFAEPPKDGDAK